MSHQIISQNITVILCLVHSAERREMGDEKNLENRVKQYLKDHGCWCLKYWAGGGFTKSGIPDLLICCRGRLIGCELKASYGRPSALQITELRRIQKAGGAGILLYPKHLDVFRELIDAMIQADTATEEKCMQIFQEVFEEWERRLQ